MNNPFSNPVNILEHIISPRIVNHDGNGEYIVKTDLTNIQDIYVNGTIYGGGSPGSALPAGVEYGDYLFFDTNGYAPGAGVWATGRNEVHIGAFAGKNNQGTGSVAIGLNAGNTSQGINSVAIGLNAGNTGQHSSAIAIGNSAGQNGQIDGGISIGLNAGQNNQLQDSIAIGTTSGQIDQETQCISIGLAAGQTSQGTGSVAIGSSSGNDNQGAYSVAIGPATGQTHQGAYDVAIGYQAGNTGQGTGSVAIGDYAGATNQGIDSVAIGSLAGFTGQGNYSVAIGVGAGRNSQGTGSVAIGNIVGVYQSSNCIAIGNSSFGSVSAPQPQYSIVLTTDNSFSTGITGAAGATGGLFVSPINSSSVTYNQLSYNTASKEIIYSSVAPKYYTYSKTFTSSNSSNLNLFTTTTHCSVAIVGYASYSSGGYDTSGAYVDYRFVVTDAVDDGSGGNTTARACINTFNQNHGFTVTANQIGVLNYLFQLVCSNTGALTTSAIGMTVIVTVC
jgi:hypothetical protein